uniref:Mu-like prophage protein gp16 n=1 Tax=Candidatus Kentrum sp. TC TaxID=2126339 RepID=A0A450YYL6_9GAMM|nr:MAG: Mu-like prophage protein gp16 [Candidatus Kentron sp. TC]
MARPQEKQRLIKLAHVGKRELGMSDDAWRALLANRFGAGSSRDLDVSRLRSLIERLKELGFRPRNKTGAKSRSARPNTDLGQKRKIREIWIFLADAGIARDRSERALAAFAKRRFRVDAIQFLPANDASALIENLKEWGKRELPKKIAALRKRSDGSGGIPDHDPMKGISFDAMRDHYEALIRKEDTRCEK